MLELPEAKVIFGQLTRTIVGKTIVKVEANTSSHKFAFFSGDLAAYCYSADIFWRECVFLPDLPAYCKVGNDLDRGCCIPTHTHRVPCRQGTLRASRAGGTVPNSFHKMNLPHRLQHFDYSQSGAYFVTISTVNRNNLLCEIVGE